MEKEAHDALTQAAISQRQAQEMFDKAKKYYYKKQYLYATELFQKIIIDYPDYDSPNFYYNKIKNLMKEKSFSSFESDFEEYAYSSGYVNYYENNYRQCLKEWTKYLQFDNKNEEIQHYYDKVKEIVNNSIEEEKKKNFEFEANEMLKKGTILFKNKQWVACIKQMEKLQAFVKMSKYSNSFNYYSLAKEYINNSVIELTKTIKRQNIEEEKNVDKETESVVIIDEKLANEKYREGLIMYAKGKYYEAERIFELTLRLNPNHVRAQKALKHLREK